MNFEDERNKGFTIRSYTGLPLIYDSAWVREQNNRMLRRQAIWAIRHPNKVMPSPSLIEGACW